MQQSSIISLSKPKKHNTLTHWRVWCLVSIFCQHWCGSFVYHHILLAPTSETNPSNTKHRQQLKCKIRTTHGNLNCISKPHSIIMKAYSPNLTSSFQRESGFSHPTMMKSNTSPMQVLFQHVIREMWPVSKFEWKMYSDKILTVFCARQENESCIHIYVLFVLRQLRLWWWTYNFQNLTNAKVHSHTDRLRMF